MAFVVNGNSMPASMEGKGRYMFETPPEIAQNGEGAGVHAPYARVVWAWPSLTFAEYDWWAVTVLSGAPSAVLTGTTQLNNNRRTLTTYSHIKVNLPVYGSIRGGRYWDVEITLEQIS